MKLKKLLSVILAAVMLLGCMSIPAFAEDPQVLEGFSDGDGSEGNPYQIATVGELANLAEIVNGGNTCADTYFELTDNIGSTQAPVTTVIGGYGSDRIILSFKGHFDGNGFTVTLSIAKSPDEIMSELNGLGVEELDEFTIQRIVSDPDMAEMILGPLLDGVTMEQVMAILSQGPKDNAGLFGYLGEGGEIKNVTTAGSVNGISEVGGVCGYNVGTVTNCYNTGTVNGHFKYVGGVCGSNGGTVTNCCNTGTVSGNEDVGGVCGIHWEGTITNCYNTGTVNGQSDDVGGVCGWNSATMTNCYNSGTVSGDESVGGVCGGNWDTITNCYYDNAAYSGDAVGYDDEETANCYGLPTAQCKGAAGTPDALVDKLNGYTDTETGKYPEDWETWVIGADGYPTFGSEPENDFLTSFTLNKDYNDKYSTGNKTTAVNETVTYTITAISTGDDVPELPDTFTIEVTDGVGSADVALPTVTKAGDYWYSITETGGKTAGVTYDTNTYYLHLITDCKDGEFGVVSAQIHVTEPDLTETDYEDQFVNNASDKIDTVSNSYGEGTLKITQDTTVNDEDNDYDAFTESVTFTLPEGTTIISNITYTDSEGEHTITPDDWTDGSVTVTVDIKGGGTVTFEGIPDGTTYTVEQTDSNTDLGYGDPVYTVENGEADEDVVVTDENTGKKSVTGTISDGEDDVIIANEMNTPIDVGVILENGAFIILALGALIAAAWLVIAKRKNRESVDAE